MAMDEKFRGGKDRLMVVSGRRRWVLEPLMRLGPERKLPFCDGCGEEYWLHDGDLYCPVCGLPPPDVGVGHRCRVACDCGGTLRALYAEKGIEATVSTAPPIVVTPYDSVDMRCPHGTLWFAEPTSEQRAKWARERTP